MTIQFKQKPDFNKVIKRLGGSMNNPTPGKTQKPSSKLKIKPSTKSFTIKWTSTF